MPVYEYEHQGKACSFGKIFEIEQPLSEDKLEKCPGCGKPIQRLISRGFLCTPKTDSELKDMGFTKLVRRDKGVYENVTASGKEHRYMEAGKPETQPDLDRKISD